MTRPFPTLSRPLLGVGLALLLATFAVDTLCPRGTLRANGILDQPFFRAFSDYDTDKGGRLGHTASRIEVPGFGARESVDVTLDLDAAGEPLLLNHETPVSGASLSVAANERGWISLQLEDPAGKKRGIFRLNEVRFRAAPAIGPPGRLLLETAILALLALLAAWTFPAPRDQCLAFGLFGALGLFALFFFRAYLLAHLPLVLGLLLAGIPFLALVHVLGIPRGVSGILLLVFLLRVGLVLLPSFPSIDAEFHAHNVDRLAKGEVLKSRAPGPERGQSLAVPYPPALYVLLYPIPGAREGPEGVRLLTGLLEGTAPLLIFLVLRAGGASKEIAGDGALVNACIPEGVLVLGKGIAANILGSWTTLLVAWAWMRAAPVAILAALLTLTLLSHWGVTLCLSVLLAFYLFQVPKEQRVRLVVATAIAAALSWVLYYREVVALATGAAASLGSHLAGAPTQFLRIRWVRVLKTLQDLLLKFGGGSLILALWGRAELPGALARLVRPWVWAGLLLGVVALVTPVPLRFEYFLTVPVSLAAAYGATRLRREGRSRTLVALVGLGLSLEIVIAIFLVFQRFDLISVIQESDSWTFPFYWYTRTSG